LDINKNWKIESDELNVKILKRYISKKNGDCWRTEGYFQTVKGAFCSLVQREVKGTGMTDLETIVKKIDGLEADINRIIDQAELRTKG